MIITASNTFKDRLKIFSETPIVNKELGFYYYGDRSIKPSTEAVPHWIIHSKKNPNLKYPEYFDKDKEKIDKLFDFLDLVRKVEKDKKDK